MKLQKIFLTLLLITLCTAIYAANFTIEATTDKDTVEFGDSLTLTLTLTQEFSGFGGSSETPQLPRLTSIPNFDIAGAQSSHNTSIINGRGINQISTVYELVPQKDGTFEIPAITLKDKSGYQTSTKPITVKVLPPSSQQKEEDSEEESSADTSSDDSEASRSMFKALLMMGLILLLFISIPFVYFYLKSSSIKKNTIWEKANNVAADPKPNSPADPAPASSANSDKPLLKPVVRRKNQEAKSDLKYEKHVAITKKDSGDYKMHSDYKEFQSKIDAAGTTINKIRTEAKKVLVGQENLLDFLILALIADGHILLEGVPGLAKTLAIKALAKTVKTDFSRIQFTPDLLPADLIGTRIFNQKTTEFQTHKGPIFSNFVLADEINRAPAKVQSALLEAMEERQVTIEHETFKLAEPFLVLATQNPIETEGTYTLSEAQVDRFLFKVIVKYPSFDEERIIVQRMGLAEKSHQLGIIKPVLEASDITGLRSLASEIYVDEKIIDYILRIVEATRKPEAYGLDLANYIRFGASPRASIYLTRAARAHALLAGRTYVKPDDVKAVMTEVLRHRVIPTYEAEADEVDSDAIVETIKEGVEV